MKSAPRHQGSPDTKHDFRWVAFFGETGEDVEIKGTYK